jgi:hypothetical protein
MSPGFDGLAFEKPIGEEDDVSGSRTIRTEITADA